MILSDDERSPPPPAGVDAFCDEFEAAWLAGREPRIEDFLSQGDRAHQDVLLQELLLAEWDLRQELGPQAELSTYLARFPESRHAITDLWRIWNEEQADSLPHGSTVSSGESRDGALLAEPGTLIDRYKLLEKLGEGGFGTVWAAEQREPVKRRVALKVIKLGMDTRQVVARFEAERQALALMDHANIAKVFDAGATETGRPYFVMELVHGTPITQYCDQERLTTHSRLDLFMKVCHAIQHAHQKGIIHRDIKPSNILVTLHDGVPVPKVIDFGVAKAIQQELTEKTIYTQLAQFIGTPAYMSPEQAEMTGLNIDTRSDIYSLGVLLYELLTGVTPFDAEELMRSGLDEMRKIIREKEPLTPSSRLTKNLQSKDAGSNQSVNDLPRSAIDRDLDWIVMKCLEKDRTRRYETASGLAADLNRHLNNEPVVARPPSAAYRLQRAWRRNKLAFSAVGAVSCALLLGVVVSTWQAVRAIDAREETAELLYTSDMGRAQQAWEANNVGLVLELLERHQDRKRPGDFEWYYLWRLCRRSLLTPTFETNSPALAVALSPDGKTLACGGMEGEVVLINTSADYMRKLGTHSSQVFSVAYSPDGALLASASADRTVRLWEVGGTQQTQQITKFTEITGYTDWVTSVVFSPSGKLLATGSYDKQVSLWNVATGELEWRSEDGRYVDAVAFSPDGKIVASANQGLEKPDIPAGIKLRDAVTGRVLHNTTTPFAHAIKFSPDGNSLATASSDGVVRLFDRELRILDELPGHTSAVQSLVYLDSNTLASGSSDNTVRLWDLATRSLRDTLKGHSGAVRSVACSRDGKLLVSASIDHTVRLWQMDWQSETSVLKGHESSIWSVDLSPNGSTVASGSDDSTVKLWDAVTGELKHNLQEHSEGVICIAYSPDGKTVASSGDDCAIILWDTTTGEEIHRLTGHTDTVWSLVFLEGGRMLASTGEDCTVRLWSLATGEGRTLVKRSEKIGCLSVWQDQLLALGGWDDYVIELWDLHARTRRRKLQGHLGPVKSMAFMNTGRELVTGSWDGTVRLWNLESNGESEVLMHYTDSIYALAVSPDGATLASGGTDGTVKLLDLSTRRERAALKGHTGSVLSLAFSRDGKLLVSGGVDGTVRLWRAATDEEVAGVSASSMPLR